jgi:hypothetical protein
LLKAGHGDPEGHLSLREAFTMMLLAGIPSGFRIAFVTNATPIARVFQALRGDLRRLRLDAAVFGEESDALDWLAPRTAANTRAPAL